MIVETAGVGGKKNSSKKTLTWNDFVQMMIRGEYGDNKSETHESIYRHIKYYFGRKKQLKDWIENCKQKPILDHLYELLVLDGEDMKKVIELVNLRKDVDLSDLAREYASKKEELYKEIISFCKQKNLNPKEKIWETKSWHELGGLSHKQAYYSNKRKESEKDDGDIGVKMYIKMSSCEFLESKENIEKYFDFLKEVMEEGISQSLIRGMKMPYYFQNYVIRKDGCVMYLNAVKDVKKYKEFLEFVFNKAYECGILKDLRIVFGFDTEKKSYTRILAEEMKKEIENGSKENLVSLAMNAVNSASKYVNEKVGKYIEKLHPCRKYYGDFADIVKFH